MSNALYVWNNGEKLYVSGWRRVNVYNYNSATDKYEVAIEYASYSRMNSVNCVAVNKAKDTMWVGSQTGVYRFLWDGINWV